MLALGAATRRDRSSAVAPCASRRARSRTATSRSSPRFRDMSKEHIQNHSQYIWDMRMIDLMRRGRRGSSSTRCPTSSRHRRRDEGREPQLAHGRARLPDGRRGLRVRNGHRHRQRHRRMEPRAGGRMSEAVLGLVVPACRTSSSRRTRTPGTRDSGRVRGGPPADRESGADLLVLYSTQWSEHHRPQIQPIEPVWNHVDPGGTSSARCRTSSASTSTSHRRTRRREVARAPDANRRLPRLPDRHGLGRRAEAPEPRQRAPRDDGFLQHVRGPRRDDRARKGGRRRRAPDRSSPRRDRRHGARNRLHTKPIPFAEDRISSLKDDEWNKSSSALRRGRRTSRSWRARSRRKRTATTR